MLLIAGVAVWQATPRRVGAREIARPEPASTGHEVVVSQPLTVGQLVSTQPLAVERLITARESVVQIRTHAGGFREVGDGELLTLAEPQIAALIRRGPHEVELVFVPPPDTAVQ